MSLTRVSGAITSVQTFYLYLYQYLMHNANAMKKFAVITFCQCMILATHRIHACYGMTQAWKLIAYLSVADSVTLPSFERQVYADLHKFTVRPC